MKIAILGSGAIGSTFAFHLARNAHDVTMIARGKRLEQLQAEKAVITVSDQRAEVNVATALDPAVEFDLVLVAVLASQVAAVLPALKASRAKNVMFMFNTFESLDRLRDAVGKQRFAFGFPAILASLADGKLKFQVFKRGQSTIATDAVWAKVFTDAGIFTAAEDDMHSWLRTHAVLIAVLMSMASLTYARPSIGVSWAEAKNYALAMREGFGLVRRLGNTITPSRMRLLSRMPTIMLASGLWSLSRLKMMRDIGASGPSEPRTLIDQISAAAVPNYSSVLRSIRP